MKNSTLLNGAIHSTIAKMGHTDIIAVGDCGLPIPAETERIDIALKRGTPGFLDTLEAVLSELNIESAVVASELINSSSALYAEIESHLAGAEIRQVPHEQLKQMLKTAKAVIRTGECTAYANIILVAGAAF